MCIVTRRIVSVTAVEVYFLMGLRQEEGVHSWSQAYLDRGAECQSVFNSMASVWLSFVPQLVSLNKVDAGSCVQ